MRKNLDGLRPSPPLGYNLGTPASEYVVERGMPSKSRLFLDVVRYVENHNMAPFAEILDSLQLFRIAVAAPNYWGVRELYDITWNDAKPRYIFSVVEDVREISTEDGTVTVTENARRVRSISDLITEYRLMEFVDGRQDGTMLDEDKVSTYPDLRPIISHLERNPWTPEVRTILAALYITADQEDRAIDMYGRILEKESHDYYNLGTICLVEEQEYELAKIRFEEALESDEELAEARYNLGVTYLRMEEWQNAVKHFEELAEPYDPESIEDKLTIDGEEVQLWDGKILLEHAIKQFSCNNLGVCHYRINSNLKEARKWFEAALSWRFITELPDGVYNENYVLKKYREIAEGPPESPKRKKRQDRFSDIIGNSEAMLAVYDEMELVVDTDLNILLTGEAGVGKEKVAEEIHKASSRKDKDFIIVDCAGITDPTIEDELFGHERNAYAGADAMKEGAFERAGGGTIFIREICDMSEELLSKTLRGIERREFRRLGGKEPKKTDARFIMATTKDLEVELKEGRLRRELYDLMYKYPISIPPLRDRTEDILPLAEHFVREFSIEHEVNKPHLSEHVREFLQLYDWPGNVRELKSTMERAVVRAKGMVIHLKDLREIVVSFVKGLNEELGGLKRKKSKGNSDSNRIKKIDQLVGRIMHYILEESANNQSEAAKQMGVERSWITRNIKK